MNFALLRMLPTTSTTRIRQPTPYCNISFACAGFWAVKPIWSVHVAMPEEGTAFLVDYWAENSSKESVWKGFQRVSTQLTSEQSPALQGWDALPWHMFRDSLLGEHSTMCLAASQNLVVPGFLYFSPNCKRRRHTDALSQDSPHSLLIRPPFAPSPRVLGRGPGMAKSAPGSSSSRSAAATV